RRVNVSLVVISIVLLWLAFVSFMRLPEMGRWSNPNRTPLPILSDWYFLALYQVVKYMPPLWAGIAPALLIGYGMLVPFLDRSKETRPLEGPFFVVGVMALIYWIGFSAVIVLNIAVISRDPPIIMAVTFVVLALAFVWEVVHRRRKAQKAAQLQAQAVPHPVAEQRAAS